MRPERTSMNQTFAFYDARANESAAEAAVAKLDMVRERALRSEKTWRTLADQAQRLHDERAKAELAKLARQQADAELLAAQAEEMLTAEADVAELDESDDTDDEADEIDLATDSVN